MAALLKNRLISFSVAPCQPNERQRHATASARNSTYSSDTQDLVGIVEQALADLYARPLHHEREQQPSKRERDVTASHSSALAPVSPETATHLLCRPPLLPCVFLTSGALSFQPGHGYGTRNAARSLPPRMTE